MWVRLWAVLTRATWVKACGKLPTIRCRAWVVLLGQEADVVGHPGEALGEGSALVVAPLEQQVVGQPERAGQKGALTSGESGDLAGGVGRVAPDEPVVAEAGLDGSATVPVTLRSVAGRNPTRGIMKRLASSSGRP